MSRNAISYLLIGLKGMAMGAADVVPGVSGGTIAFISGIYEELLTSIDNLDLELFKSWKKTGFKTVWKNYNLAFLCSLFLGILVSIFSLAKIISYLLDTYPIAIWSFFFGLVLASIIYIGKQIKQWSIGVICALLIGCVIAYLVTIAVPVQGPEALYFFFLSGCIAIIAMILPGISGSFILVILGSYAMVLGSLTNFITGVLEGNWDVVKTNFIKVLVFILGCITGLKIFSKALKWMFTNKKELTLAVLTGFMIGSLNKIWPWKKVLSTRIDRHGEEQVVQAKSILPAAFEGDPKMISAVVFAIAGFALLFLLERAARGKTSHENRD